MAFKLDSLQMPRSSNMMCESFKKFFKISYMGYVVDREFSLIIVKHVNRFFDVILSMLKPLLLVEKSNILPVGYLYLLLTLRVLPQSSH